MNNISEHITYEEAIHSDYAINHKIDNTPNAEQLSNMRVVAENIFEPTRVHFGVKIGLDSFFRSQLVNIGVGGSKTSDHMQGKSMDINGHLYGGVTNKEIFQYIKNNLEFDQLIAEFPDEDGEPRWVHASYREEGNRNMVMMSKKDDNGKTIYEKIA